MSFPPYCVSSELLQYTGCEFVPLCDYNYKRVVFFTAGYEHLRDHLGPGHLKFWEPRLKRSYGGLIFFRIKIWSQFFSAKTCGSDNYFVRNITPYAFSCLIVTNEKIKTFNPSSGGVRFKLLPGEVS